MEKLKAYIPANYTGDIDKYKDYDIIRPLFSDVQIMNDYHGFNIFFSASRSDFTGEVTTHYEVVTTDGEFNQYFNTLEDAIKWILI